jgi:hypothetical protein
VEIIIVPGHLPLLVSNKHAALHGWFLDADFTPSEMLPPVTTSHPAAAAPGAPPVVSGADAGKIARAAFVGTALEWYDYYLFGTAAALVFNRLFFTNMDPTAALLASFATFGVGFAARPIGAIIF